MTTIRVDVTQEDIEQGEPGEPEYCAIARALVRQTEELWAICDDGVPQLVAQRWRDQKAVPLPSLAVQFATDFDAGKPVQPFAFDLDLPGNTR